MHPSVLLKRDLMPCIEHLREAGQADREIYRTLLNRGFAEDAVRGCLHSSPTRRRRPKWLPRLEQSHAHAW